MLCAAYKSIRNPQTYLFIAKRGDFSKVPALLLEKFGPPQLLSILNITENKKMAIAEAKNVIKEVTNKGFYLQLPPPQINYLEEHKKRKQQQLELEE